ncbi:type VI secretion system tip protein VgrG [Proteus sp. G2618]|uniref:type VI secretion system Vgr family protein n=1 Tax=Proteus sp. G2618 TaxID=2698841 RepID=UPI0013766018|nr:type VI secretion system Vgr family protein [Proteus sp. G2618]NBN69625.1 type VI secretion system tip protein VgrG [Proteus sp. G2618]
MNIIDLVKNTLIGQNRYHLNVQGCDVLFDVEHFTGREAISDTYHYQITFTCQAQDLQPQQLLRRSATLSFTPPINSITDLATQEPITKHVHGVITQFRRLSGSVDEARYQLVIEPVFALLRHQIRSHRFFLNQSVPDVVSQILREHNFKDWEFEFTLKNDYPKREQINQYNESDRQFIERLLSEVGIFYSFYLQDQTQTEVIRFADRQSAYTFDKTLPLNSPSGMNDNHQESVWGLSLHHQVVEQNVFTKDYNHRQAQDTLISAVTDMTRGEGDEVHYGEVYHYQARHLARGDKLTPEAETANFWARLDHERFLTRQTRLKGESNADFLSPLQVLSITDNAIPSSLPSVFQSPILITRLRFSGGREKALQVWFNAIPYSETLCWRPVVKPRPIITGTLTARITSAKDNDIYAHQNEHGFYWVKFDADRDEKPMGYESMPVRLAKPYAGDTYGMHFPLIQGTEVAIAFHEGDPDRPYIAHALHDSRHPDHVTDRNNTRNVIRTPANNKLRMEDKRGEEHIKLSTEYGGKSQLSLGHIVDANRDKRGEGFELRTDSWGAIRAGKGLFISADNQTKAGGEVLAMDPAISLVKGAISQLDDCREITQAHHNLQPEKEGLDNLLKNTDKLASPSILMHAPEGIGIVTNETLLMQSVEALYAQTKGEMHLSSTQKIAVNAYQQISMLSQKEGIRIVSGKGPFELESHGDIFEATALKDITVQSTQGHIQLTAKNGITLGCGGGYIKIMPDGQIEIHTPSRLSLKGQHIWSEPASEDFPLPDLPQSVCKECLKKAQENAMGVAIRE